MGKFRLPNNGVTRFAKKSTGEILAGVLVQVASAWIAKKFIDAFIEKKDEPAPMTMVTQNVFIGDTDAENEIEIEES